ncbi:ABC transporter substrate-binding protein [Sinorhizobium mexicanum]|uniref:ABC transporter substrate-binding protein n=1 Tax=Sinorhizobium mexicanum TaxID=375549 RepID=A0A859QRR7_9HYPH|nr:ABC transporter substrate-binding protein [Sinorhizobium mexicanum]MBP1884120.1 sulfonate transport system substrate-binding protein [Sinorhizobium mexicanum]QLL64837.1 ABC transporter substrate-binding protein [Sinorhizobium mexicanum]
MNRRTFLSFASTFSLGLALGLPKAAANVDASTTLAIADQSEFVRNLLDASGKTSELGFKASFPNFAGGPAILEAIRAGALDIAYVGDTPPIQARAAGTLLPIVGTFTRQVAQYRLTSRPGLVINKLAELKGKKLSYVEGSGRQVFLIEALNRAGVSLKDVELVNLRVADLPDAIRSGTVDVAVLTEPHVTRLVRQAGASPVLDPVERQILPSTSYFYARPDVLADSKKAAAIENFLAAFARAAKWSNANRQAWAKYYFTDFQRISPDETAAIVAAESPLLLQTSAEAIPHHQKLIDILYQAGSLRERFDAKTSFVDTYDSIIAAER